MDQSAHILWKYNQLNQKLYRADFIFVMCSYNLIVADRVAELFHDGMGDFIAVSGGIAHQGDLVETPWEQPEAIVFTERLIELNVPKDKIIIEDKAQNCGDNVQYTKAILKERDLNLKTGIVVQKPYMERRAIGTCEKQWPEITWQVTSPNVNYEAYLNGGDEDHLINILVGDTQRVIKYAELGYQTTQEMPEYVTQALKKLIKQGYIKHLIKDAL